MWIFLIIVGVTALILCSFIFDLRGWRSYLLNGWVAIASAIPLLLDQLFYIPWQEVIPPSWVGYVPWITLGIAALGIFFRSRVDSDDGSSREEMY